MSYTEGIQLRTVSITKNSFPLQVGDILEKYGKKFRKPKGKYGKPVFIVVGVDPNHNNPEYYMSAVVGYHQFNNTIVMNSNKNSERVIGTYLGKAKEKGEIVVWDTPRDKIKKVEHCK